MTDYTEQDASQLVNNNLTFYAEVLTVLIYMITNDVNSKVYVGQTTKSLANRIQNHKNSMVSGVDTHLYRAMRLYGWNKFHFHVIAETHDQDTLNELEQYYIAKYNSIQEGYNMAPGGAINTMSSPVVKSKHDAKMRDPEVRQKISESMKKSYAVRGGPSDEHRKKLSESRKALYASDKGKEVISKFRSSFVLSDSHYKALNDAKNKAVYCINMSGQILQTFDRVKDAALWWYNNGYGNVKSYEQLNDRIRESAKHNKYIRGLKWVYRV